jgi:RNA binding exosome subunit
MEFPFRAANISTFAHATEDEKKVLKALGVLLPEGVDVSKTKLKGHYGNIIFTLTASTEQRKLVREFWVRITTKLSDGELNMLRAAVPESVDEKCNLHLRFDKQLAYEGELAFTKGGDAIHVRLKLAAYPAKHEVATKLVQELISDMVPVSEVDNSIKKFSD